MKARNDARKKPRLQVAKIVPEGYLKFVDAKAPGVILRMFGEEFNTPFSLIEWH